MKFRKGQRVIILDAGVHEIGSSRKGEVVATYADRGMASGEHGYKVAVDGMRGGTLYFRESQLKEEK